MANAIKSLDNYFKLDIDRLLSSDISNEEETHEKVKSKNNVGKRVFCGGRSFGGKKSYGNNIFLYDTTGLETIERDFVRRMEAKKMVMTKFTEKATSIYSTKFGELLRKHEMEMNEFKKTFVQNVKSEIDKWRKCLNNVRREEQKLMKFLKHLRKVYNSPEFRNGRLRKLADMHEEFFQKYEELVKKQNSEVKSLKEVVEEEVNDVKRNLSQEFWKIESNLKKNSIISHCSHYRTNL